MTAQAAAFDVSIDRDGVFINGTPLGTSGPAFRFYAIFGRPNRIIDGSRTPAPAGHRNNQFHYYDAHGVTLNEHHYTHQIHAINFVINTELSDHPTERAFHGELNIGGLQVINGTLERQLSSSDLQFAARLPGKWFTTIPSLVDGQAITVAVSTHGPKLKSGRRGRTKLISCVSICLSHDPWDTAHIPK